MKEPRSVAKETGIRHSQKCQNVNILPDAAALEQVSEDQMEWKAGQVIIKRLLFGGAISNLVNSAIK